MPRLLVLAPCEKVIISQDENNPTLIALLQDLGVEFQLPDNTPPQLIEELIVPMRWNIFTLWRVTDGDAAKTFVQVTRIRTASGKTLIDQTVEFVMEKTAQRIVANISGIPIKGGSGTWTIQVFLHEKGKPIPKEPAGYYAIDVHIVEKKPS